MAYETRFTDEVAKLLAPTTARSSVLVVAKLFDKYIEPNKAFADSQSILAVAQELAEALEKEISTLRQETGPDRDEQLALARAYKKSIKGFLTHAYKV